MTDDLWMLDYLSSVDAVMEHVSRLAPAENHKAIRSVIEAWTKIVRINAIYEVRSEIYHIDLWKKMEEKS